MEEIRVGVTNPVILDNPDVIWGVASGKAEIYAVEFVDGKASGSRLHLFTAEPGQNLYGVCAADGWENVRLLAYGNPEVALSAKNKQAMVQKAEETGNFMFLEPLVFMLENWIAGLSEGIVRRQAAPQRSTILELGGELTGERAAVVRTMEDIIWVKLLTGEVHLLGNPQLTITGGQALPLAQPLWLQLAQESQLQSIEVEELVDFAGASQYQALFAAIELFHSLVLKQLLFSFRENERQARLRLKHKKANDAKAVRRAFTKLSQIFAPAQEGMLADEVTDPLLVCCRHVAAAAAMKPGSIVRPEGDENTAGWQGYTGLTQIADASAFRLHPVTLRDGWWRCDNGPLLAFAAADDRPVAVIPVSPGAYKCFDSKQGKYVPLDEELAYSLAPVVYMFFRPLPREALVADDLFRFAVDSCRKADIWVILLTCIAGGLLSTVTPLATGILFNDIIPATDHGELLLMGVVLLVASISTMVLEYVRAIALLRVEGRVNSALEGALWDRLLNLPPRFFRQFSVGDLAMRANGINAIRQLLSGTVIGTLLSAVFSVFNAGVMFFYGWKLALIGVVAVGIYVLMLYIVCRIQYRYRAQLTEAGGRIAGLMLQVINGIAKFRMAGAENTAFYLWAQEYARQQALDVKARRYHYYMTVVSAGYRTVVLMILYYMMVTSTDSGMSTGNFLAFTAAFTTFFTAMAGMANLLMAIIDVFPLYDRVKPILEALPEVTEIKRHPGVLTGDIRVHHLNFRYSPDGPLILDNVSITAQKGEFVAIVGPSGSGKSTLLRLLMGFEQPDSGTILFDGQDLGGLNIHGVRSQFGVVLQNGQLMSGDILTNIIGTSLLTVEDAREAAAMAGLDKDIEQMPMGMFTVISEGASTLSGGQRQRLLIARALVKKPRIIMFDEATSALDNTTQSIVGKSLERLSATRIVVAHRLSTIMDADRIYVMEKGKVVQSGTYDSLMEEPGLFAELARRQLA